MESITYLNTSVDGITYSRILDMEIRHSIGAHGSAALALEADIDSAPETVNRIDEQTLISICTTADGQPKQGDSRGRCLQVSWTASAWN